MCRCHPCRESPTLCLAGIKPSSFALVVWVFVCWAATQCCSCCSCWSSPGCFQDHCSATMWKSRQLMLTLCCSCCCTCLLYCWHTKAQGLVDPRCCTYVHWHNWCCERVLILNIHIPIYIYISTVPLCIRISIDKTYLSTQTVTSVLWHVVF